MKTLTADLIQKANDLQVEPVDVPEWGGRIFVRNFSAKLREAFEDLLPEEEGGEAAPHFCARVVVLAACDETGGPLFKPEDADWLVNKSAVALMRVYDKAAALNKLRKKDVEGEKKESAGPPPAGLPTA